MRIKSLLMTLAILVIATQLGAVELDIFTDSTKYAFGDDINVFISCTNQWEMINGDLYIMILDPAGTLFFMPDQTVQYITIPDWTRRTTAAVPNLTLNDFFSVKDLKILSFGIPSAKGYPPVKSSGEYTFGIAYTKHGTLDIMSIDTCTFDFENTMSNKQSDCVSDPIYFRTFEEQPEVRDGQVSVNVEGNDITIYHDNVIYNCAAVIEYETYLSPHKEIVIIEHETLPNGAAYCICEFDLEIEITDLKPGDYVLKMYREDTSHIFGEFYFTIEGTFSYKATRCKDFQEEPNTFSGWDDYNPNGEVSFSVYKNSLIVNHTDVQYNCSAHIVMTAEIQRNVITIDELETFPDEPPVFCECPFDVTGFVMNLDPGEYLVKLINRSRAKEFAETKIVIE